MQPQQLIFLVFGELNQVDDHLFEILVGSCVFEDLVLFVGEVTDKCEDILGFLIFVGENFRLKLVERLLVFDQLGAVLIEPSHFRRQLLDLLGLEFEGLHELGVKYRVIGDVLHALTHESIILDIFKVFKLEIQPKNPLPHLQILFFTLSPFPTDLNHR